MNVPFAFINSVGPPLSEFIWLSPALGGISFVQRNNSMRPEEIAGCGWYVQDFQGTCGLLPGSGSCPNDSNSTCKYTLQDIVSNQVSNGSLGRVIENELGITVTPQMAAIAAVQEGPWAAKSLAKRIGIQTHYVVSHNLAATAPTAGVASRLS